MKRVNLSLAAVCLVSVLSIACSGTKTAASDAQITADIQSKLYSDPTTKQSSVNVAVKDGAVTLTGDVPNSDVELAAMKIANSVSGVRGVADQMKVNSASAASQPAPAPPVATPATQSKSSGSTPPSQVASQTEPNYPPPSASSRPETPPSSSMSQSTPSEPRPAPKPVEPERVTIAAGQRLSVRTVDAIDSSKVSEGQALRATLDSPLVSEGQVIVPAGAPITLQVTSAKGAGRIRGESELSLQATSLEYRGRNYPIRTSAYEEQGKARGKNTALKTGIGAGVGALIGGLAGGGKGAAIGAGAGGGAGFGFNALTHGQQVKVPSESVLNFRLEAPLVVPGPR